MHEKAEKAKNHFQCNARKCRKTEIKWNAREKKKQTCFNFHPRMVACVLCPHSCYDFILKPGHGLFCLRTKGFLIPTTSNSCITLGTCISRFQVLSYPWTKHFIDVAIHADKVVQRTSSGDNQSLSRLWIGVHVIKNQEPHLQHSKTPLNDHADWGMLVVK